jgi:hypothetical protein
VVWVGRDVVKSHHRIGDIVHAAKVYVEIDYRTQPVIPDASDSKVVILAIPSREAVACILGHDC